MPFSNSIWGACCFESSSGHHESSSIEFWPCFQNYSIFNLSWTSFHSLSPLRCLLRQRTRMFPDLTQWGWFVLTYLLFWFATGLKYDRVAGILHNASAGASVPQQASSVITSPHSPGCCTSRWWAASLRAVWDEPKEMDLPSAGLNQTPSGSTCTHKNNTHKWHMWAIASSSFSCKIALYSAAYVFKQVILMEKKQKQIFLQGWGKPVAKTTFRNNVNSGVLTETSLIIQPSSSLPHRRWLHPLPFASLPCWHKRAHLASEVPFSLMLYLGSTAMRMIHKLHHQAFTLPSLKSWLSKAIKNTEINGH